MTGLADGSRVLKSGLRIDAIGTVDEFNSLIGLLLCEELPSEIQEELLVIQYELFGIGAELAGASERFIGEKQVNRLEKLAEKYDANLSPLTGFILPGGSRAGAFFHFSRTVCRRAERSVFALAEKENIGESIGKYLNRLSDLLFIYARAVNKQTGKVEYLWQKSKSGIS